MKNKKTLVWLFSFLVVSVVGLTVALNSVYSLDYNQMKALSRENTMTRSTNVAPIAGQRAEQLKKHITVEQMVPPVLDNMISDMLRDIPCLKREQECMEVMQLCPNPTQAQPNAYFGVLTYGYFEKCVAGEAPFDVSFFGTGLPDCKSSIPKVCEVGSQGWLFRDKEICSEKSLGMKFDFTCTGSQIKPICQDGTSFVEVKDDFDVNQISQKATGLTGQSFVAACKDGIAYGVKDFAVSDMIGVTSTKQCCLFPDRDGNGNIESCDDAVQFGDDPVEKCMNVTGGNQLCVKGTVKSGPWRCIAEISMK